MTSDHREVEKKFDLDDASELPDLLGLPGVSSVTAHDHLLEATYFDTPDLALAAAGVTLRRRTGGDDAGWHLKLPVEGARQEVHAPLGRATRTPPLALRAIVAGVVREQPLSAVVSLRTERRLQRLHDEVGTVLAEVADDRVAAEPATPGAPGLAPMKWREAEVELVSAGPSLLEAAADLLVSAGAARSTSASKLGRALGDRRPVAETVDWPRPRKKGPAADLIQLRLLEQVSVLRHMDPLVRHDAPDAVHAMRVAIRRLRNALASYGGFLDPAQTQPLRDELGWLAALLGGPRDNEVLHGLLLGLVDQERSDLVRGPVRRRIDRDLSARYRTAREELLTSLTSARYFELIDRLDDFAHQPPWTDRAHEQVRHVLPERLDRDWKRLRKRVRAAAEPAEVEDAREYAGRLHAVRKAAKRVRYAAEPLVPLYGKSAARTVRAHERIQTVLGDDHDTAVAQHALLELADHAAAEGENAFSYGLLHARVERSPAERAATLDQAWRASAKARAKHRVG